MTDLPGALPPAPFPVAMLICGMCGGDWATHLERAQAELPEGSLLEGVPTSNHCEPATRKTYADSTS